MAEYCSFIDRKQLEQEFLQFKPSHLLAQKYVTQLVRKSRFVDYLVSTEARKTDCYVVRLRDDIRAFQ